MFFERHKKKAYSSKTCLFHYNKIGLVNYVKHILFCTFSEAF